MLGPTPSCQPDLRCACRRFAASWGLPLERRGTALSGMGPGDTRSSALNAPIGTVMPPPTQAPTSQEKLQQPQPSADFGEPAYAVAGGARGRGAACVCDHAAACPTRVQCHPPPLSGPSTPIPYPTPPPPSEYSTHHPRPSQPLPTHRQHCHHLTHHPGSPCNAGTAKPPDGTDVAAPALYTITSQRLCRRACRFGACPLCSRPAMPQHPSPPWSCPAGGGVTQVLSRCRLQRQGWGAALLAATYS